MSPGIYLVTDRVLCGDRGVVETVRSAVRGGIGAVQLRDKTASFQEQLRQVEQLAEVIDGRALLLLNDRLDVAVEAHRCGIPLDGVHLGQGDTTAGVARRELWPGAIIGLTANTSAHLRALTRVPHGTVDYLGIGAIRPTPTKSDHPPPLGIDGFAALARQAPVASVAIGGIRPGDVGPLRRAAAGGVAVASAICAATDPEGAARRLTRLWREAAPEHTPPEQAALGSINPLAQETPRCPNRPAPPHPEAGSP